MSLSKICKPYVLILAALLVIPGVAAADPCPNGCGADCFSHAFQTWQDCLEGTSSFCNDWYFDDAQFCEEYCAGPESGGWCDDVPEGGVPEEDEENAGNGNGNGDNDGHDTDVSPLCTAKRSGLGWFHTSFTSLEDGVVCDLDADTDLEQCSWIAPSAAGDVGCYVTVSEEEEALLQGGGSFLPNGRDHLFGDVRFQPPNASPNGFLSLAWLCDATGEGTRVLPAECGVKLWVDGLIDGQPNGRMEQGELIETAEWGITELDFGYHHVPGLVDSHGNAGRFASSIRGQHVLDIFFQVRPIE